MFWLIDMLASDSIFQGSTLQMRGIFISEKITSSDGAITSNVTVSGHSAINNNSIICCQSRIMGDTVIENCTKLIIYG